MDRTARPRWRRRKEARPSEIIEAALESFAERGFAATRLDDVAARAGVTRGTLYLYFPSKEELFKAMVRQTILPVFAERSAMIAHSTRPTPELLRELIEGVPAVLTAARVAAIPKLIIAEARNFPDLAEFYFAEVVSLARRRIRALIRRGIARGEFRPVDVDHVFYCIVSPVLMTALWRQTFGPWDRKAPDLAALCRTHADLLLHGLSAERGAA
jgi:AcrR family transcriptional regulator